MLNSTIRFFCYAIDDEGDVDMYEITENQFTALQLLVPGAIDYTRHTVRENGCNQVCLSFMPDGEYAHFDELERI